MTMPDPLGLTVTVEDFDDQSLQLSFEPGCFPEQRESSDGNIELVVPFELLTYALAQAIDALENYDEEE